MQLEASLGIGMHLDNGHKVETVGTMSGGIQGFEKLRSLSCVNSKTYLTMCDDIFVNSRNSCQILGVTAS